MSWSIERAVVGFLSGAAVFVQGVLDAVSPPNFQPVGDAHPIPGCPDAVECRTHGCAGNCSEASEVASGAYLEEVGATLADEYRPAYEAAMARKCAHHTSPAVSADAGDSPSEACDIPPSPSEGRSTSIEAICEVLADHHPFEGAGGIECSSEAADFETPYSVDHLRHFSDKQKWREHVAPLIAEALAPQPKYG